MHFRQYDGKNRNDEEAMKILVGHRFGKERLADAKEISRLYELYKSPFISFALKYYPVKEETAEDIYQESFTIMFRNVRDGKYRDRQASLKTYLFEIGKHRICTHLAKNKLEFVPIQTLSSERSQERRVGKPVESMTPK